MERWLLLGVKGDSDMNCCFGREKKMFCGTHALLDEDDILTVRAERSSFVLRKLLRSHSATISSSEMYPEWKEYASKNYYQYNVILALGHKCLTLNTPFPLN